MCKVNSSLYSGQKPVANKPIETSGETHWIPNTDVYVTEDSLIIKVELAGMQPEHLELSFDGNRLMISGQRPDGCRAPKCKFLVMEINYGPFECVIEIPPGYDVGRARAQYNNGFLRVDVPQAVPASRRTAIPVGKGK
jgi:HSP20 family protein